PHARYPEGAVVTTSLSRTGRLAGFRPRPRDLFRQHLHGLADLLLGVRGGAEGPEARRGLFDGGVEKRLHVDSPLLEGIADLKRVQRVPQDGRNDRALRREARVDSLLLRQPEEQRRSLVQARHLLRMRLELPQRLQRRGGVRRRDAHAEHETTGAVLRNWTSCLLPQT